VARVVLIHWNEDEARGRLAALRRAGHRVSLARPGSSADLRVLRDDPPDAFVIDLDRLPSHGRAVATELRQRKATRGVPLVFVGGAQEKITRVRAALPDATFAAWTDIGPALRKAMRIRPAAPIVPGTMSGYSGTPLPKKLGIPPEGHVALLDAPEGFEKSLGSLPVEVRLRRTARGAPARRVMLFVRSRAGLRRRLATATRALDEEGGLWIAWPKKSSGVATDVSQEDVRRTGLASGLVDYKICAIDGTWSGLLFARRASKGEK
jgi:hypothetical protein